MSQSSSESEEEEEDDYFESQLHKLQVMIDQNLNLEVTKPLIGEAITFLESADDYGTKKVQNAITMLDILPLFLSNSLFDIDSVQLCKCRYEIAQYLIEQGFSSVAVKMIKTLQEKLSSTNKSDQSVDQC